MNRGNDGALAALQLKDIRRGFKQGIQRLEVLAGIQLSLQAGEVVALVGPSGAGKSTLLHISGLLEQPDSGEILIGGKNLGQASEAERTRTRRTEIGFVYQFHHLLPEFSALENVMLPQRLAGRSKSQARGRSRELLESLGLSARLSHRPAELSGGEQQRVAIARALANEPRILLADEPTGNLDPKTAGKVHEELINLVRGTGLAALIATHNLGLAEQMDRMVRFENGILLEGPALD